MRRQLRRVVLGLVCATLIALITYFGLLRAAHAFTH